MIFIIGVTLLFHARGNDTCTICNCSDCPLEGNDCNEILAAVNGNSNTENKGRHILVLHTIYVQENAQARIETEKKQESLIKRYPDLEELD